MTATFRRVAKCPNCYFEIPLEDDVSSWIRRHPELRSGDGFVFMDKDLVCHRTRTTHGKTKQLIMFVEVKTRMRKLGASQRDTMWMVDQLFRNDRTTPTKKQKRHTNTTPRRVVSSFSGGEVDVMALGYHLLTLSGEDPDSSQVMFWNKRQIDARQLIALLRFEIHPDTFGPLDFRSHHDKSQGMDTLPGLEL